MVSTLLDDLATALVVVRWWQTNIMAFDGLDGSLLWSTNPGVGWGYAGMTVGANGVLYAASSNINGPTDDNSFESRLFAVNASDGRVVWTVDSFMHGYGSGTFNYAVIGGAGSLLVGINGTLQFYV